LYTLPPGADNEDLVDSVVVSNSLHHCVAVVPTTIRSLSEVADYRKIHGRCNVPSVYSENVKLGSWVRQQRYRYKRRAEGKKSSMTLPRIQALESLGFEWRPSISWGKGTPKNPSLNADVTRVREKAVESSEHMQQYSLKNISEEEKSAGISSTSLSNPKYPNPTGMAKATSTSFRVEPKKDERVKIGDARFDETDLDGSPSELAAKPSLYKPEKISIRKYMYR
jgi:hypothetical protein